MCLCVRTELRTDLSLVYQVLEERGVATGRERGEAHAQETVRGGRVETRGLCERDQCLVRGRQPGHADRVGVDVAFDITGPVLHGCASALRYASFVVLGVESTALVACAFGTGDEDVGATGVELHGEGLLIVFFSHAHGAIVFLIEIGVLHLINESLGNQSGL